MAPALRTMVKFRMYATPVPAAPSATMLRTGPGVRCGGTGASGTVIAAIWRDAQHSCPAARMTGGAGEADRKRRE